MDSEKEPYIEAILQSFLDKLSPYERVILAKSLSIPNSPESQPEVMALFFEYGEAWQEVINKLEVLRQKLGLNYNDLQKLLGDKMVID